MSASTEQTDVTDLEQTQRADAGLRWMPKAAWPKHMLIGDELVEGGGQELPVENPSTGEVFTSLREASATQLNEAVKAARRAFDAGMWGNPQERRLALHRLADLFEAHKEDLGGTLIQELGTPISLIAPLQLGTPIELLRYYAEQALVDRTRFLGRHHSPTAPSESMVRQVPVGVVAAITAYNYPLLMFALKIAPALAAGCSVVVLPSPQTPLSTLLAAQLVKDAGFPPGVVNVIVGGAEIGRALSEHPEVDKVTFTGSVAVGRAVMSQAARTLKGVVLELGGKSAAIILPSCDLRETVSSCHQRYMRNAGQGCASPTRLLVHQDKVGEFLELSRSVFATVQVGDPWDPETVVGPLISKAHRERVEAYVDRALAAGAQVAAGGGRPDIQRGWYMNPTLLSDLDNSFEVAREELFGPVGVMLPYNDVDEAIALANDSELGLAAAVYGEQREALDVAKQLRVGSIYVNGGGSIRMDAPMGGFKQSGVGREYGEEGIREFLEPQHIQWSVS